MFGKTLLAVYLIFGFNHLICNAQIGFGGKQINVRNANSLEFDETLSGAQRLIGNVIFEHEGTLLYCDSAYLYESTNKLDAFSNVRIQSDSIRISGDRLSYDGKTKIADITGRVVKLIDNTATLTSDRLKFDTEHNIVSYYNGARITSTKNNYELNSRKGEYHSRDKFLYFSQNVTLVNRDFSIQCDTLNYNLKSETAFFVGPTKIKSKENSMYCESGLYNTKQDYGEFRKNAQIFNSKEKIKADEITFNQKSKSGFAKKNVMITDTSGQVILTGHKADYSQNSGNIVLSDSAVMRKIFSNDTLFLHGDTLVSLSKENQTQRILSAFHRVKFYKRDFQGKADSLTYSEKDSVIRLFGNPVIWNNANQLSADTVRIYMQNSELKELIMRKNAMIISEVDSSRFNQISGKYITGHFWDNELRKIDVKGNGQSLYYVRDNDEQYIGLNKVSCSHLEIFTDSARVQKIAFHHKPDATLIPMNQIEKAETILKGFEWLNEQRPNNKNDIFRWQILVKENEKRKSRRKK